MPLMTSKHVQQGGIKYEHNRIHIVWGNHYSHCGSGDRRITSNIHIHKRGHVTCPN